MGKHAAKILFILLASSALLGCSGRKELQLEVKATLDGGPAAEAQVVVDGAEVGSTGDDGTYSGALRKKPGSEVRVSVIMNAPGYKVEPWEDSFVMRTPAKGAVDAYPFEAELKAVKYITFSVTEKGAPVEGAAVKVGGKKVASTDAEGQFVYEYKSMPGKGFRLDVRKKGFAPWRKTRKVEPGQVVAVSLHKESLLTIKPLTEEYGRTKGMAGVPVSINGKRVGKTNSKGYYTYVYRGEPGKKVRVSLSTPGYLPSSWKGSVKLEGRHTVKRYFYPVAPRPIRAAIYGYASNMPDEDLSGILRRIEDAVGNNLFSYMVFEEVPSDALKASIKKAKTDIGRMTTKGWEDTALMGTVDAVILGSVGKTENGFVIETKAYNYDGKLVLGHISPARGERDVKRVAKDVVKAFIGQFPFEGTITAVEGDAYKINLGSSDYKLRRGAEFALMAPSKAANGKIKGYAEAGTLRLKKTRSTESWGEVVEVKKGKKAAAGYRVVRRTASEEEKRAAEHSFVLLAKGGVPPDVDRLGGVNVYLNDAWVATTGSDGKAVVPVKLGRTYDVVLYRHGYRQMSGRVKAGEDGELKEYVLEVNNAMFKVDSRPSGAEVFMDGVSVGKTPITDGRRVNFGFHTLRLSAGGDIRDWEEVVEFNRKVVELTGKNSIKMHRDYLKIADRARAGGDTDKAISAYLKAGDDHPDYSDARYRLAQLYMDDKNDYPAAAREFENVLSVPENEQLIYKQYAVTYTNLGHAYYEMGNALIREDRGTAAEHLSDAVRNLDMAKQNTRFLPTKHYDEAVHDTYYYSALSYHKLYLLTRKDALLEKADMAWREYFDFFPEKLEGQSAFTEIRASAEKYWGQIKDIR
jgi:tetratricopeptide (TPR) repeat protein